MALLTIGPTKFDRGIAAVVANHANPQVEQIVETVTYAADEHLLLAASLGFWLFSQAGPRRQRRFAEYLVANVIVSTALPHLLKRLVDQKRPDRTVHGLRRGIPVSGKPNDAFPSGHAVHIGAIASAVSRYFPELKTALWTIGGGIAATRILLLAHWTTDVIAGLALGKAVERGLWSFRQLTLRR
jgi:undecaprenyl-diphosphatase